MASARASSIERAPIERSDETAARVTCARMSARDGTAGTRGAACSSADGAMANEGAGARPRPGAGTRAAAAGGSRAGGTTTAGTRTGVGAGTRAEESAGTTAARGRGTRADEERGRAGGSSTAAAGGRDGSSTAGREEASGEGRKTRAWTRRPPACRTAAGDSCPGAERFKDAPTAAGARTRGGRGTGDGRRSETAAAPEEAPTRGDERREEEADEEPDDDEAPQAKAPAGDAARRGREWRTRGVGGSTVPAAGRHMAHRPARGERRTRESAARSTTATKSAAWVSLPDATVDFENNETVIHPNGHSWLNGYVSSLWSRSPYSSSGLRGLVS